jgi:hypothetical protein
MGRRRSKTFKIKNIYIFMTIGYKDILVTSLCHKIER